MSDCPDPFHQGDSDARRGHPRVSLSFHASGPRSR